jgi:alkylated DNA repair dioxygenase AlkB
MNSLFSIPPELPEGFYYYPDFITAREEILLVDLIRKYPLKNMMFQGFEAKRKVISFGYDYHFDSRRLTEGIPIPREFIPLISKVAGRLNIPPGEFTKVLLTEYDTGTVINWHRDAPPFEKIAGISLLSDCTFKLRPYDKSKQVRAALRSFTVERRSLYLMEGVVRDEWEHSIAPVKSPRYSITIRTLRNRK